MKGKRIIGIDVARAVAVIGMILVNFKMVLGSEGNGTIKQIVQLFDGKAAATFVVLAGVGLALMTNTALQNKDSKKLKLSQQRIVKRAVFLFIVGLSYLWIWPADILHFYGIYMLISLLFLRASSKTILIGCFAFVLIFPILLLFFNYETGWNFETLDYKGFWEINGFFRNLFFNGFHPVIPWTAFMLYGLWLGRQNLNNHKFVKKLFGIGLSIFLVIQVLSTVAIQWLRSSGKPIDEELGLFLSTSPMPPLPLYMINGISIATVIITGCILLTNGKENHWLIELLKNTGKLALTFYVAHVVIGMGAIEIFGTKGYGEYSISFSAIYALIFSLICIVFAHFWLQKKKAGPLEWIMRKLTD